LDLEYLAQQNKNGGTSRRPWQDAATSAGVGARFQQSNRCQHGQANSHLSQCSLHIAFLSVDKSVLTYAIFDLCQF